MNKFTTSILVIICVILFWTSIDISRYIDSNLAEKKSQGEALARTNRTLESMCLDVKVESGSTVIIYENK